MNDKIKFKPILIVIILIIFSPSDIFGSEPILITYSETMNDVIFDGKWTHRTEWKNSAEDKLSFNDMEIILRTAHQENFIFILVNVIGDTHLDQGSDKVILCFDTKNDKTSKPGIDDYCFMSVLGRNDPITFQGNSSIAINGYLKKITNPENLIGISSSSDENDRYSKISHPTFEFKIPTDLISRSNTYGFYLSLYDAHQNKYFLWPENSNPNNLLHVVSPINWGELISPDKSLPEFKFPFLILVPSLFIIIYLTNFKKFFKIFI